MLDEWSPGDESKDRDVALAELARRYFMSHGPATLQDFAWWSGLSMRDAKAATEMAKSRLHQERIGQRTYWFSSTMSRLSDELPRALLLPAYDEYAVAYKDRNAVLDPLYARRPDSGKGIFFPIVVLNGQVVGNWQRTLERGEVVITPRLSVPIKKADRHALREAAEGYGKFFKLPAILG